MFDASHIPPSPYEYITVMFSFSRVLLIKILMPLIDALFSMPGATLMPRR